MRLKLLQRYLFLCCFLTLAIWITFSLLAFLYNEKQMTRESLYLDLENDDDESNDAADGDIGHKDEDDVIRLGIVRNKADLKFREEGYSKHAMNLLVSKRLGLHREIKDTRHELCQVKTYSSSLPSTSVIICFHNEALTVLLRTIHSVLDRTPQYLHEIILVDDFSDILNLKEELENYLKNIPKVRLVRTKKREGLIRGRLAGASVAEGEVMVFLDSHCEVNINWLPPLLDRIKANPTTVVCPVIDIISAHTFKYTASPLVRGGFNWGLHFTWEPLPSSLLKKPEDYVNPIRSPTMAGGLFAINKEYFHHLGDYDAGMDIWGAENLEISFRIWMCGGNLEIIPCSRVGHVFRQWRPYSSGLKGDTMSWNSMRLAEVWLDDYKKYFYEIHQDLQGKPFGNITSRIQLRKALKCKSFKWYLQNVYPEMRIPNQGGPAMWNQQKRRNPAVVSKGKLESKGNSGYCLDSPGHPSEKKAKVVLNFCDETNSKYWSLNEDNELKIDSLLCLEASSWQAKKSIKNMKCHGQGGNQEWKFLKKKGLLFNPATGLCLSIGDDKTIQLDICSKLKFQKWKFMKL